MHFCLWVAGATHGDGCAVDVNVMISWLLRFNAVLSEVPFRAVDLHPGVKGTTDVQKVLGNVVTLQPLIVEVIDVEENLEQSQGHPLWHVNLCHCICENGINAKQKEQIRTNVHSNVKQWRNGGITKDISVHIILILLFFATARLNWHVSHGYQLLSVGQDLPLTLSVVQL